jgi:two-component system cell cycle response regulator DivK
VKHVIVVEDDPVNAILFRKLLENGSGCRVTVTESPVEILSLARAGADAILMDVSLRHSLHEGTLLNGVDICRLLKADPTTARVPVILATAHAMRGDAEALLERSGADDYIPKPITDLGAFAKQISGWLEKPAA